jgi:hypothetical protein
MRTKPFSELRKRMTPERRAKNKTRAQLVLLYLALAELQESLGVTQDDIKNLGVVQFTLSELENPENINEKQ